MTGNRNTGEQNQPTVHSGALSRDHPETNTLQNTKIINLGSISLIQRLGHFVCVWVAVYSSQGSRISTPANLPALPPSFYVFVILLQIFIFPIQFICKKTRRRCNFFTIWNISRLKNLWFSFIDLKKTSICLNILILPTSDCHVSWIKKALFRQKAQKLATSQSGKFWYKKKIYATSFYIFGF